MSKIDEKDIEIAKLRGQLEAMDGIVRRLMAADPAEVARLRGHVDALEKQLALHAIHPTIGLAPVVPCIHLSRDLCGRCMACGHILVSPLYQQQWWTSTIGPMDPSWIPHNAAACNPNVGFTTVTLDTPVGGGCLQPYLSAPGIGFS